MRNFYNKILDIINVIFSKLSIVIIVLILGILIYSRLDKLFKIGLISEGSIINNTLNQINQEEIIENNDGPARIIYRGELPSDNLEEVANEETEEAEEPAETISFNIIPEQTPQQVTRMLRDLGLISDPASLILLMENQGLIDSIQPGSYEVKDNILNQELISVITNTEYQPADTEETANETNEDTTESSSSSEIDLVTFEILEGQTPEEVAASLRDVDLIQDPQSFILLIDNANLRDEIKPGVYRVPSNIRNLDLVETITIAVQP